MKRSTRRLQENMRRVMKEGQADGKLTNANRGKLWRITFGNGDVGYTYAHTLGGICGQMSRAGASLADATIELVDDQHT